MQGYLLSERTTSLGLDPHAGYNKIYLYLEDGSSEIYNNLVEEMSISVGTPSKLKSFANQFQKVSFLQQFLA